MAVNAITGVDPAVDRFAIYRVSTEQYTNFNAAWPRTDGGPIEGGNPDYKWYKRTQSQVPPTADHRFTVQATWERIDADPTPPEGHPAGVYQQSHTETKRPKDELKTQVETEFNRQVEIHIPATSVPSELAAQIGANTRLLKGASLTARQQGKQNRAIEIDDKLVQLEARRDELLAAIDADEDYDILEGWVVS